MTPQQSFTKNWVVYADIGMSNPLDSTIAPIVVTALVDSGVSYLCIPEHMIHPLGLDVRVANMREIIVNGGERQRLPYVGPLRLAFENRSCFTGALVWGNEIRLGSIPMQDMDVSVQSEQLRLVVAPGNPNFAASVVK